MCLKRHEQGTLICFVLFRRLRRQLDSLKELLSERDHKNKSTTKDSYYWPSFNCMSGNQYTQSDDLNVPEGTQLLSNHRSPTYLNPQRTVYLQEQTRWLGRMLAV